MKANEKPEPKRCHVCNELECDHPRGQFCSVDPWGEEPDTDPSDEEREEQQVFDEQSTRFEAQGGEPTKSIIGDTDKPIEMILSNGAAALRIQHAWMAAIDYVMTQQEITNADVFLAIRNTLLSFCLGAIQQKLEDNPIGAYINKTAMIAMLDGVKAEIESWNIPTPPEH